MLKKCRKDDCIWGNQIHHQKKKNSEEKKKKKNQKQRNTDNQCAIENVDYVDRPTELKFDLRGEIVLLQIFFFLFKIFLY